MLTVRRVPFALCIAIVLALGARLARPASEREGPRAEEAVGAGRDTPLSQQEETGAEQLSKTIRHEIGHGVGLKHCDKEWRRMSPNTWWLNPETNSRELRTKGGYTAVSHDHNSEYDLVYSLAVPW